MILLSIHPVLQSIAILLAYYTAYLGLPRTLSLHFGKRTRFDRRRHALFGTIALGAILGGITGGVIVISHFLHGPILSGIHGKAAIAGLPLLLFGLVSGIFLYRSPRPRKLLPALHALNNLLVLLFTLFQGYTGVALYLFYLSKG